MGGLGGLDGLDVHSNPQFYTRSSYTVTSNQSSTTVIRWVRSRRGHAKEKYPILAWSPGPSRSSRARAVRLVSESLADAIADVCTAGVDRSANIRSKHRPPVVECFFPPGLACVALRLHAFASNCATWPNLVHHLRLVSCGRLSFLFLPQTVFSISTSFP